MISMTFTTKQLYHLQAAMITALREGALHNSFGARDRFADAYAEHQDTPVDERHAVLLTKDELWATVAAMSWYRGVVMADHLMGGSETWRKRSPTAYAAVIARCEERERCAPSCDIIADVDDLDRLTYDTWKGLES